MSLEVEGMWIHTGSYGWFRGKLVKVPAIKDKLVGY